MALKLSKLNTVWKEKAIEFLTAANDKITIYKKGASVGTKSSYDSFFDEGTNPNNPGGVTRESLTPVILYGHVSLGASLSKSDRDDMIEVGRLENNIVIFTGKASDILNENGTTVFDGCEYVAVEKTGKNYKVKKSPIPNGLSEVVEYRVILERI